MIPSRARGWVRVYADGRGDIAALTRDLGRCFEAEHIAIKMHCMSHTIFPVIEAAAELMQDHGLTSDDIGRVTIVGPSYIRENMWRTDVSCFADAVCSAPFAVAIALLEPEPATLPSKVLRLISDPKVDALLTRFAFEVDPDLPMNSGQLPGALAVDTDDGRRFVRRSAPTCRGTYPESPLAAGAIEHKFSEAADGILSSGQIDKFISTVHDLDNCDDIADLVRLLT
jgi:2-methylcitrate dehydratase PrpD